MEVPEASTSSSVEASTTSTKKINSDSYLFAGALIIEVESGKKGEIVEILPKRDSLPGPRFKYRLIDWSPTKLFIAAPPDFNGLELSEPVVSPFIDLSPGEFS